MRGQSGAVVCYQAESEVARKRRKKYISARYEVGKTGQNAIPFRSKVSPKIVSLRIVGVTDKMTFLQLVEMARILISAPYEGSYQLTRLSDCVLYSESIPLAAWRAVKVNNSFAKFSIPFCTFH